MPILQKIINIGIAKAVKSPDKPIAWEIWIATSFTDTSNVNAADHPPKLDKPYILEPGKVFLFTSRRTTK